MVAGAIIDSQHSRQIGGITVSFTIGRIVSPTGKPGVVPPSSGTGQHIQVAALYVETGGCYFDVPGVDPWDEARDARLYDGPHPVVAHPPCQRWGAMAAVNYARWGGEHNRPGNDGGCFRAALSAVRKWGGVLEHPAKSRAWDAHGLTKPVGKGWQPNSGGGWVCEVWQSAYGHRANKATWLFTPTIDRPAELDWSRLVGSHQVGFQDQRGKARNKPTLSRSEAAATPPAFQQVLLSIARTGTPTGDLLPASGHCGGVCPCDGPAAVFGHPSFHEV